MSKQDTTSATLGDHCDICGKVGEHVCAWPRPNEAPARNDEPRPGGGSRYTYPAPRPNEAMPRCTCDDFCEGPCPAHPNPDDPYAKDRPNEATAEALALVQVLRSCPTEDVALEAFARWQDKDRTDYPTPKVGDVTPQGTVQEVFVRIRVRRSDGADVYLTPEETQKSSGLWTDCLPGTGQKRSDGT